MLTVLLVLLILIAFGGIPALGFHSYGWGPSSAVAVVVVVLLVLLLLGRV